MNNPRNDSAFVDVTFHDGESEKWWFPNYYTAQRYIDLIPLRQVAGDEEALQIARARLGRGLMGVN